MMLMINPQLKIGVTVYWYYFSGNYRHVGSGEVISFDQTTVCFVTSDFYLPRPEIQFREIPEGPHSDNLYFDRECLSPVWLVARNGEVVKPFLIEHPECR